ncbi:MAG: hypothetical protein JWN14_3943 [Chthonomonadales bacterium]|nr:hypothetical protein [Chthonomonadales bacterium]
MENHWDRLYALLARLEALLRGENDGFETLPIRRALPRLVALISVFGALYGGVMGSFGGLYGDRILQICFAAIKVPLLLLGVFVLGLPSFYVFNTLMGLRSDFGQAVRALMASQAGLAILLASLAPLTLGWNITSLDYPQTILYNGAMFALATAGGQILLRRRYRDLIARDPRHQILLRIWGLQYGFVGIQLGWILRPFIGDLGRPVSFFRPDGWSNAYVFLFQMLHDVLFKK